MTTDRQDIQPDFNDELSDEALDRAYGEHVPSTPFCGNTKPCSCTSDRDVRS